MAASVWKMCQQRKFIKKLIFPAYNSKFNQYSTKSDKTDNALSVDSLFADSETTGKTPNLDADTIKGKSSLSDTAKELSVDVERPVEEDEKKSFATYLRESRFMQLGDLKNKLLSGRITDVHENDLYIDFGGKFGCVCPKPSYQPEKYIRGAYVKLNLNKFEMTSKFLGSEKHVTLLEADCTLLGIFPSPNPTKSSDKEATPES